VKKCRCLFHPATSPCVTEKILFKDTGVNSLSSKDVVP
jgi:hypothetical protein